MNTLKLHKILIATLVPLVLIPFIAAAQTSSDFSSDGLFGCNQTGAISMSVGTLSANGGVYVPVNDSAVTLNTGYLVYKECVLREIVDNEAHSATSALIKKYLSDFMVGKDGNPLFSQDINKEQLNVENAQLTQDNLDPVLNNVNPAFRTSVTRAIVRQYAQLTHQGGTSISDPLTCSYTGDLSQVLSNKQFSWSGFAAEADPACNPMFAGELANDQVTAKEDDAVDNMMTRLQWGQGTYDMQAVSTDGKTITVTPASVINALTQQAVTSGFRQTENANDIGQMVNSLFAGMSDEILGNSNGLVGITQSSNGQPSILDQVAKQSATTLVGSAVNAGLGVLTSMQTVESSYNQALHKIGDLIVSLINGLRGNENVCWNSIIQHVCAGGNATTTSSGTTCTDTSGNTLHIATSTAFSQAVINSQLLGTAQNISSNIKTSDAAISAINKQISGLANSTSLDAQSIALQQLSSQMSSNSFHSAQDVANINSQYLAIQASTGSLVNDTLATWANANGDQAAAYPASQAWCDVNNSALLSYWDSQWKQ